jgi:hypothetical protein
MANTYSDYLLEEITVDDQQDLKVLVDRIMILAGSMKPGQRCVVWVLMEETDSNPFPHVTEGK